MGMEMKADIIVLEKGNGRFIQYPIADKQQSSLCQMYLVWSILVASL